MRRRQFITLLGGLSVGAVSAGAESATSIRHIGMLMGSNSVDPQMQARLAGFTEGLKKLGWTLGADVEIIALWDGGSPERAVANARELVARAVDIIVANGTIGIEAARAVTRSIPIVFALVGNPVGRGYVESLAHPGGDVTGFSAFEPAILGKWMELLYEMAPRTREILLLSYPGYEFFWKGAVAAAPALGLKVTEANCADENEIMRSISASASAPGTGLVVLPAPFLATKRDLIARLAATYRTPAIYPFRYFAQSGGLMSYGIDTIDIYRRAASYVDQILKGTKPASLPVQAPTKFELVINLNSAKAMQLSVSPTLLARADEVIG